VPYRQSLPPTDLGQADSQTEAFVYAELRCDRTALVSAILRAGLENKNQDRNIGQLAADGSGPLQMQRPACMIQKRP